MRITYVMMMLAVLFLAGCLGGGEEKKAITKTPEAEANNAVSLQLSPWDVTMMPGEMVDHDFVLKFMEPAPGYVRIQPEKGDMDIKITPDPLKVIEGPTGQVATGRITFAPPISYPLGDQVTELLITDTNGNLLGKVTVDFYVLPPGAS